MKYMESVKLDLVGIFRSNKKDDLKVVDPLDFHPTFWLRILSY